MWGQGDQPVPVCLLADSLKPSCAGRGRQVAQGGGCLLVAPLGLWAARMHEGTRELNLMSPQVWKQKWWKKGEHFGGGGSGPSRLLDRGPDACFKCGELGHWASQCKGGGKSAWLLSPGPMASGTQART